MIDRLGHDPRSAYVERFWLSILGPSTVVLMRRLASELDDHPEGVTLDLAETAASIGVGMQGRPAVGVHAHARPGLPLRWRPVAGTRARSPSGASCRRSPAASSIRLSPGLQQQHDAWVGLDRHVHRHDDVARMRERARGLALSLLELGEDPAAAEQQLHRWRFHPAVAHEAMRWALDRHRELTDEPPLDAA